MTNAARNALETEGRIERVITELGWLFERAIESVGAKEEAHEYLAELSKALAEKDAEIEGLTRDKAAAIQHWQGRLAVAETENARLQRGIVDRLIEHAEERCSYFIGVDQAGNPVECERCYQIQRIVEALPQAAARASHAKSIRARGDRERP